MASINTLPLELIIRITDLSVEDAIALQEEKLRRRILTRLSLVCKDFTLPSQQALWKYMKQGDTIAVNNLIVSGFGKDKVIEKLSFKCFDNVAQLSDAVVFLEGVHKVKSLSVTLGQNIYKSNVDFWDLSSIKALRGGSPSFHHSSPRERRL